MAETKAERDARLKKGAEGNDIPQQEAEKVDEEKVDEEKVDEEKVDEEKVDEVVEEEKTTGKGKKKVEIGEDTLKAILEKQEKLENTIQQQAKDIEILREVADKGRLSKADQMRADGKIMKKVRVSKIGDMYVVGWKRIKDEVYTDERGVIHEDQEVEYYFNDGEPQRMSDVRFSRNRRWENCEVISETKDKDGKLTYTVITPKGLELPIDITFVN